MGEALSPGLFMLQGPGLHLLPLFSLGRNDETSYSIFSFWKLVWVS